MSDSDQQDGDRTPTGETVDVAEAARWLGVTPDAIRARLHRGTLAGEKVDGQWRVRLSAEEMSTKPLTSEPTGSRQDATAGGDSTDRMQQDANRPATVDLAPLVDEISRLNQRNEELAAAAGMWQARARSLEEQLQQLTATAGEASGSPETSETADRDARGSVVGQNAQQRAESVWQRLARWFGGGGRG